MRRRAVLKSLAVLTGAAIAGLWPSGPDPRWVGIDWATGPDRTTFGYLDVDGCLARGLNPSTARVFLDGVDVTALKVQAADDRRGFITLLRRNAHGACYLQGDALARETRYGHVVVTFTAEARI